MPHEILENELHDYIKKRRIIICSVCIIFFILSVVFSVLYETTKVVNEIDYGFGSYSYTTYNHGLGFLTAASWILMFFTLLIIICDIIFIKCHSVEVNGDCITLYRGYIHTYLYINGEMKDELYFYGFTLEGTLSDGSKVYVALSKYRAHFSFTNGQPSFEI